MLQSRQLNKRVTLNVGGVRHEVMWKMLESIPRSDKTFYYCAVSLFCTNQAGFSNKSAIHNSHRLMEASDWEFCPSRMGNNKFP